MWGRRFEESTRGKIVGLLRRAPHTVEEMAAALGLTDNAIRAQLVALERDGLVRQQGLRRGAGKPSYSYALSAEYEPVLSQAYIPLLLRVLRELGDRMPERQLARVLRAVGRRWAAELPRVSDGKSKPAVASELLNSLGGVTTVERSSVRGFSCPLALAVKENPRVCLAVEALLSGMLGVPVQEHCDRSSDRVQCCFEIGAASRGPRSSKA
jgi:predicted ArsR family transcriptional regulator